MRYDRDGDAHYDVISAFIKSMRGSDVDAALHWLARMLVAGEDARFIARRMVIFASEDVGMADPTALQRATAAAHAVEFVGLPEAQLNLAQAVIHLATAPKSNAVTTALGAAMADVRAGRGGAVPPHLRDAHYSGARGLGHGDGYRYPHDDPRGVVTQQYAPDDLVGTDYYRPSGHGAERAVASGCRCCAGSSGACRAARRVRTAPYRRSGRHGSARRAGRQRADEGGAAPPGRVSSETVVRSGRRTAPTSGATRAPRAAAGAAGAAEPRGGGAGQRRGVRLDRRPAYAPSNSAASWARRPDRTRRAGPPPARRSRRRPEPRPAGRAPGRPRRPVRDAGPRPGQAVRPDAVTRATRRRRRHRPARAPVPGTGGPRARVASGRPVPAPAVPRGGRRTPAEPAHRPPGAAQPTGTPAGQPVRRQRGAPSPAAAADGEPPRPVAAPAERSAVERPGRRAVGVRRHPPRHAGRAESRRVRAAGARVRSSGEAPDRAAHPAARRVRTSGRPRRRLRIGPPGDAEPPPTSPPLAPRPG